MKELKIKISVDAFNLLEKLNEGGYIEYRDCKYPTIDEFINSSESSDMTLESFKYRNGDGTLYLIYELDVFNFVEDVEDAWHTTYKISELGEKILELNK